MDFGNFRWIWNISFLTELVYTPHDVYILLPGSSGTKVSEIPLVEKVHDQNANCKYQPASTCYHISDFLNDHNTLIAHGSLIKTFKSSL